MDQWILWQIISHPNNLFEIMSKEPVKRERNLHNRVQSKEGSTDYLHSLKLSDLQLHLMCFHEMILFFLCLADSDYENANRTADVDVELMAFQSIIGDDYKGQSFLCTYWETVI